MQEPVFIGSHGVNRVLRFDNAWPSLDIFKGNDTNILFVAKTSGPNVILDQNGFELSNIDLTNARSIIFLVADAEKNDAIILTKTTDVNGGITITDAINGKVTIQIQRTDFSNVDAGIYSCEVAFQDQDGFVHTLARTVLNLFHSLTEGM